MEKNTHPEELEQEATKAESDVQEQAQEDTGRDRRSFLTRAAIGVAGAAGLMAVGSQAARAESRNAAAKSKILERIKTQMAAQDIEPIEDGGGGDAYLKNSHALYLKR